MGGMVAQEIAIAYPNRVLSLMLMSTSGYIGDPELPGLTTGALARSVWRGLPLLKYRLLGGEQNLIRGIYTGVRSGMRTSPLNRVSNASHTLRPCFRVVEM
jgi:pimeloyl-ACP methyl ester carboxylesterase